MTFVVSDITEAECVGMQRAAEARLAALDEELFGDEAAPLAVPPPLSAGPYCGCQTCVVRETLDAAFLWLEEARA